MRTLVIGFGNPSRRDDGVALAVINDLRAHLGQAALEEGDDGYDDLGGEIDTLFLQQLSPELAETLAEYRRVIFVDAHVGAGSEGLILRTEISPHDDAGLVSHHFKPGRLLALAATLYGGAPSAELISIRGSDFDFGQELSPETSEAARQVARELWDQFRYKPV